MKNEYGILQESLAATIKSTDEELAARVAVEIEMFGGPRDAEDIRDESRRLQDRQGRVAFEAERGEDRSKNIGL